MSICIQVIFVWIVGLKVDITMKYLTNVVVVEIVEIAEISIVKIVMEKLIKKFVRTSFFISNLYQNKSNFKLFNLIYYLSQLIYYFILVY